MEENIQSQELSPSITAVTSGLPDRLRVCAGMISMCEPIEFGSDALLMGEAADEIEVLDFERTALRAERNELLEALKMVLRADDEWKVLTTLERSHIEGVISRADSKAEGSPQ